MPTTPPRPGMTPTTRPTPTPRSMKISREGSRINAKASNAAANKRTHSFRRRRDNGAAPRGCSPSLPRRSEVGAVALLEGRAQEVKSLLGDIETGAHRAIGLLADQPIVGTVRHDGVRHEGLILQGQTEGAAQILDGRLGRIGLGKSEEH